MKTRIVGICGGSGSGKTTVVRKIGESFPDFVCIPQDNYYRSAFNIDNTNITHVNFDHPDAFDNELVIEQLTTLKAGKTIEMPQYDFVRHKRLEKTVGVEPHTLIIFEGILIFFDKRIRDLIDLKVFIDTPDDIRFIRRLQRDIHERGRTMDSVIQQYLEKVRPGHSGFVEPTKRYADIIIPEGGFNEIALEVLISFLRSVGSA